LLGAGGMGKVYKVRNVISDRVEAMKVLLPDLEHDPELADRSAREIKVQAGLQHPNIAALHTAIRVENQFLMIMELVEGVTLEQRLRKGPVSVHDGIDYVSQVLGALGYAHEHGVVHRDVKPANMMVTAGGVVKLMDFGIAKAASDRRLTMTGTTMGLVYYMSPEQIKGLPTIDARSDIYSAGASLYEIVTGKKPFDGDSQFSIMAAHLEKTPVSPITLDPSLPQMLNDVILRSIAKDPDQRFQSAKAFAAALANVRQILPMTAVSPSGTMAITMRPPAPQPAEPVSVASPPKVVNRRWLSVGAGALASVLALVAAIEFGPWRRTSARAQPQTAPSTASPSTPAETRPVMTRPPAQQAETSPPAQTTPTLPAAGLPAAPEQNRDVRRPARRASSAVTNAPASAAITPDGGPAEQNAVPEPQPAPAGDAAVLHELRQRLLSLATRASVVRQSLGNLKRAQASAGMSLRSDMVAAETRMNLMLAGAINALNAHDAAGAKKFDGLAEREIEKLEKFLGL